MDQRRNMGRLIRSVQGIFGARIEVFTRSSIVCRATLRFGTPSRCSRGKTIKGRFGLKRSAGATRGTRQRRALTIFPPKTHSLLR